MKLITENNRNTSSFVGFCTRILGGRSFSLQMENLMKISFLIVMGS
uniref:Uncharacterized protein n=1 Tax=Nelumbo nucifera TaxID=4432 RepID=A0A822Y5C8_NELNU|nr:TPA_asm: hypothetical protein HUJ06_030622 [Nelumbo nucifera]